VHSGFDTTPFTATVNPVQASASATTDTGFADLDETLAPDQPAAAPNTAADTGEPEDADAALNARVAALLPDKPTTDWNAVTAFMGAVVPWPASASDPGWINLVNGYVSRKVPGGRVNGKYPIGHGSPYKDLGRFVADVARNNNKPRVKDQFFCLSLQQDTGPTTQSGFVQGARSASAALAVKAIWIDVDVGKDGAYQTVEEALAAAIRFQETSGLPPYSAIVGSGGGIHLYWISDKALTPNEWRSYAEGLRALAFQHDLKCDLSVTTDIARILRLPGTFNHKTATLRPAQLFNLPLAMYDFPTQLNLLPTLALAKSTTDHAARKPTDNIFAEGMSFANFGKPDPAFASLKGEPDLNAGITTDKPLVDPNPVLEQCGFYREARDNGGRNYANFLWHLSILGTTFMEKGEEIAHLISNQHDEYSTDETTAEYDRCVVDRAEKGIGWPSCDTIAKAGCKSCATCPLLGKVKSPLSIRPIVTATVNDPGSPSGSTTQSNWTGRPGISFSNIPHRPWLYGFDLVRGELTVIGSPGGAGKSSLAIGMAICVATNRELLGEKVRGGAGLKALVINGEDSTDEIRRRVWAFSLAHGLTERDLCNLTIAGADNKWVQRISFLKTNEKGMSTINQDGLDALQLALDELHPDVIVLDPLVSFCAGGNMNDNSGMSLVMRNLKGIAAKNRCAVIIVHHTRKGGDAGNVEAISGAAAITNLARRAIMPAPLTDADSRLGILPSERPQYFKLVDAKSNLVPRGVDVPLYRLLGVELPNPEPPLYPNGDNVQAITRVVLPTQSGANPDDLKIELAIAEIVGRGKEIDGQAYPYSPSLAGANNERGLLPDAMDAVEKATAPRQWLPGDLKAVTDAAIKRMKADGRIVVGAMKDLMPNPGRFRKAAGLKVVPI
jgi:hypothetical protein